MPDRNPAPYIILVRPVGKNDGSRTWEEVDEIDGTTQERVKKAWISIQLETETEWGKTIIGDGIEIAVCPKGSWHPTTAKIVTPAPQVVLS